MMKGQLAPASSHYLGEELELFRQAGRWKDYWGQMLGPYLFGSVLEVGAGIGGTTQYLYDDRFSSWLCLEPDERLARRLRELVEASRWRNCSVWQGTVADLKMAPSFDTVLYIDVLEHIEHDKQELAAVVRRLRAGGHLIVLSPAYQWLYSPFDRRIGHYRRYTKRSLTAIIPADIRPILTRYLDSAGVLASLANAILLRQPLPTVGQLQFWNSILVRFSRISDALLGYRLGKSVCGVWRKLP